MRPSNVLPARWLRSLEGRAALPFRTLYLSFFLRPAGLGPLTSTRVSTPLEIAKMSGRSFSRRNAGDVLDGKHALGRDFFPFLNRLDFYSERPRPCALPTRFLGHHLNNFLIRHGLNGCSEGCFLVG
jgi:hypothetical protein